MKLTIQFAGICTHFRFGVAAGVPHRVVLPDASRLTAGLLSVEESPVLADKPAPYYLLPHYAQLQLNGVNADVPHGTAGAGQWVKNGDVLAGIRLQVVNAIEQQMVYDPETIVTPSLTDYVPGYTFASEVVLSGRASLYFDLYGGTVSTKTAAKGATQTVVTLTTEGRPEVLVTPLAREDRPGRSFRWPLGNEGDAEVCLNVNNLEVADPAPDPERGAFDFLLHYLTARGGIPQSIRKRTPGMPMVLSNHAMPPAVVPDVPGSGRTLTPDYEVTPSCSDSQYP
ncbi:MAG TPA: hypothetical protein VKB93_03655 [Thermoanaerobaculia bacterium]|nr:hypothetical protein [Thermoanaerobaculia bacterium]